MNNPAYKFDDTKYTGFKLEKLVMLFGIPIIGIILTFIFNNNKYQFFTANHFVHILITTAITGINWSVCRIIVIKLWNRYPWHIAPLKHILIEIPVVLFFTILLNISAYLLFSIVENSKINLYELWTSTAIIIILVSFLISLHEAMFFYFQWKENFNKSLVLEKANIKAEYDALKNQINPHFLFNNLNTLITFVDDNPKATDYIQNLSDFLRYTLDIKESDIKSVKDELAIVKKYIYLQKSRFNDKLMVDIDIKKNYYEYKIPSMSLQMVVDNAIKHNIISKEAPLSIKLHIEDDSYIVVTNNLQKRHGVISTNQGLQNLKKRYTYITEKEIIIIETKDNFIVKLPLAKLND